MQIEGRAIGGLAPPYVIAEMSNNHLRNFDKACRMIEAAASVGADAIKIQTYDADALTLDCPRPEFMIHTPPWQGRYYHELYREIAMPLDWTARLFQVAKDVGITLFSSPFDERAVQLLASLDCPAYKIASFEAEDDPLLTAVAATGKPVIMSTGVSTMAALQQSLTVLRHGGAADIALLHCVSEYPANTADMNLAAMDVLAGLGHPVGLSDHSLGWFAAVLAVARGAVIIEKHFTLSRADGGPDADFSAEPDEFTELVARVRDAHQALGDAGVLEQSNRKGREHARSLFVARPVQAGTALVAEDIRVVRPGLGLPPRALSQVLGRTVRRDLAFGDPLHWEDLT
jgi:N-acetylneuraminate synthase